MLIAKLDVLKKQSPNLEQRYGHLVMVRDDAVKHYRGAKECIRKLRVKVKIRNGGWAQNRSTHKARYLSWNLNVPRCVLVS